MANVGAGTTWNLPNYIGEIFTSDFEKTPILSMSGGLNGVKQTNNFEFPIDQQYDHETAAQPAITETASLTAPTAISYVRAQTKNVCQIFHEQVSLSYEKLANAGRLLGINTSGTNVNPANEMDFQTATALKKIARDAEFTLIQGTYQIATDAGTANKTRGLNAAAATTVAAGSVDITKIMIDSLLKAMYDAGAEFGNMVFCVNSWNKQKISDVYAYAPQDRNVGGVNIKQVETDFGNIGVLLDPFQLASVVGVYDLNHVSVVSQPVPGKGHMFYEALAKTGAAEKGQIFGKLGLDHGPTFMHGKITGTSTS